VPLKFQTLLSLQVVMNGAIGCEGEAPGVNCFEWLTGDRIVIPVRRRKTPVIWAGEDGAELCRCWAAANRQCRS
jgi:hypothetical protein